MLPVGWLRGRLAAIGCLHGRLALNGDLEAQNTRSMLGVWFGVVWVTCHVLPKVRY